MIELITIYVAATGRILRWGEMVNGVPPTLGAGEAYILGHWDAATQYVSGGVVVDRPLIDETLVDGDDYSVAPGETLSFTSVNGTRVLDGDTLQTVTTVGTEPIQITGEIDFEFQVTIEPPFPYQSAKITVKIYAD